MTPRYADRRRRRRGYPLLIQGGLIVALGLALLAFKLDWHPRPAPPAPLLLPDPVLVTEVPVTRHETLLPPPPRPPVPVAVPDDTPLDDVDLHLDDPYEIGEPLLATRPPPLDPPPPQPEADEPFEVVEEMPQIVGGIKALYEQIRYPEMARRAGIEGRVTLQFVVDREGRVVDPMVLRGVHPQLDQAALDALRKVKFAPGRQRGKAVPVRMKLPVLFRLR